MIYVRSAYRRAQWDKAARVTLGGPKSRRLQRTVTEAKYWCKKTYLSENYYHFSIGATYYFDFENPKIATEFALKFL